MIDQAKIELISKVVDQEASEPEVQELHQLLQSEPEIKELFDELNALSGKLSQSKEIDPPARLKLNIMRSIKNSQVTEKHEVSETRSITSTLREMFIEPFMAKPSFSFITGIAAGLFLFIISSDFINNQIPINNSDFSGTIGQTESAHAGESLNKSKLETSSAYFLIETFRTENQLIAHIEITPQDESRLEILFDQNKLTLATFTQVEGKIESINIKNGNIEIFNRTSSHITLFFDIADQDISDFSFTIESGENSQEGIISIK